MKTPYSLNRLNIGNIRSSEGAGTTTLTSANNRKQVFTLSAARTCVLPSTNITMGDKWIIEKSDSTAKLTISCSSAASATSKYIPSSVNICYLDSCFAYAEFTALQDTPTTPDHWDMTFKYIEKQYLADMTGQANDIAYNGGNKATLSGTGLSSVTYAAFFPYQLFNGVWKIKFNIDVNTASQQNLQLAVNGLTFKNGPTQSMAGQGDGGNNIQKQFVGSNSGNIVQGDSGANTVKRMSGDVTCESRPTWAY